MGCLVSAEPRPFGDREQSSILALPTDTVIDNPVAKRMPSKTILYREGKITDDYRFGKRLGNSAYECKYLGIHKRTGLERLIKKINRGKLQDPEKMIDEVEALRDLVSYM
jgi:calcium-dependent protein kinase